MGVGTSLFQYLNPPLTFQVGAGTPFTGQEQLLTDMVVVAAENGLLLGAMGEYKTSSLDNYDVIII